MSDWLDPKFITVIVVALGAAYKAVKSWTAGKAVAKVTEHAIEELPAEVVRPVVVKAASDLAKNADKLDRTIAKMGKLTGLKHLPPDVFKAVTPEEMARIKAGRGG